MNLRNDLINFTEGIAAISSDSITDKFVDLASKYYAVPADTSDFPEIREEYVVYKEYHQTIKLLLAERKTFFMLALQDVIKYEHSSCTRQEVFYIYK